MQFLMRFCASAVNSSVVPMGSTLPREGVMEEDAANPQEGEIIQSPFICFLDLSVLIMTIVAFQNSSICLLFICTD